MAFSPAVAVATPLRYYGIRLPERAGEDCTCGEGYRIGACDCRARLARRKTNDARGSPRLLPRDQYIRPDADGLRAIRSERHRSWRRDRPPIQGLTQHHRRLPRGERATRL